MEKLTEKQDRLKSVSTQTKPAGAGFLAIALAFNPLRSPCYNELH